MVFFRALLKWYYGVFQGSLEVVIWCFSELSWSSNMVFFRALLKWYYGVSMCLIALLKWYHCVFVFKRPLEVVQNDVFMCSSDFLKMYYYLIVLFHSLLALAIWRPGYKRELSCGGRMVSYK